MSDAMSMIIKGLFIFLCLFGLTSFSHAQNIEEVRWKSESYVRDLYGQPENIVGPIGAHSTYTLWKYPKFSVAFSNKRAFHLFQKDSLKRFDLGENR